MMPESRRCLGPRLGYRPVIDGAALTTATPPAWGGAPADDRSMSRWSTTAISPGRTRLARLFVRRSTLATAVTPGGALECVRRSVESFIARHLRPGQSPNGG